MTKYALLRIALAMNAGLDAETKQQLWRRPMRHQGLIQDEQQADLWRQLVDEKLVEHTTREGMHVFTVTPKGVQAAMAGIEWTGERGRGTPTHE